MTMPKSWRFWTVLAAAVILFGLNLYFSQPFQSCIQEATKYYGGEAVQKSASDVFVIFKAFRSCLGVYVIEKTAVITALATLAIAWFTWTLRQSSEKMWSATRESVDLAKQEFETAYRARVAITNVQIGHSKDRERISFAFRLENTGQLPATECSLSYTTSASIFNRFEPPKDDELLERERDVHIVIASKEVKEMRREALISLLSFSMSSSARP
jgi:hypothetical protein